MIRMETIKHDINRNILKYRANPSECTLTISPQTMRDIIKGNPEYFTPADVLLAQDDSLDVEMWWYAQSKSLHQPAAFFGVPLLIDEDMPDDAMAFFTHQFRKPKPNYTMSLQDV